MDGIRPSTELNEATLREIERLTLDGRCLCEMIVDADGRAADYRFLWVNHLFEAMTGLRDAVGRTALELVPDLERRWVDTYARVALGGETLTFEEGSEAMGRWFEVHAAPIEGRRFLIAFRDVSERRRATLALEAQTARAERLRAETDHRVMNTLALIGAMLRLELRGAAEATVPVLERVGRRIEAMGVLYRRLAEAGAEDAVRADSYLGELVPQIGDALIGEGRLGLSVEADPEPLATRDAVAVGLIVNDLVTNSLKYAFPDGRAGRVRVALRRRGDGLRLTVGDDGVGFEAGRADAGAAPSSGLGERLVAAFVQELGGARRLETSAGGTVVTIDLPRRAPAAA